MTVGESAQLITSIATLLGVAGSIFVSWRNGLKTDNVVAKVEHVVQATNGMKTELVNLTAKSSLAEGVLAGRAQVHEEQGNGGKS